MSDKKFRPRITEDELNILNEYRGDKENHDALIAECEANGIPADDVKYYWWKGKHFSINVANNKTDIKDVVNSILEDIKKYSPQYKSMSYQESNDGHLLVVDPADIHIGKLCKAFETGDEYNHDIAVNRVIEGVNGLIQKANGFQIDQILFVMGNDILHVDNPKNTTTAGTHQDMSVMWYDAFKIAQKLLVNCIERLIEVAPVHVQYDPSNHDYTNGFFLAQAIEAWFSKAENITFNTSISHRKYYRYHNNLIATSHGDGAKEQDLPLLMAHESEDWNACKHRYFYIHHIHHKKSKDYMSVTVEALRSPSGTDSWHHKNGYQHAPKAVEGFIHNKNHGQVARLTHIF